MNLKILRIIRRTTFILIFILAGFYASVLLRPETVPAPMPAIEDAHPESVKPVTILPEFILADVAGNSRSISEFTGQPLLINFWATWCAPCLREMPMFQSVWQEREPDHALQIIGIAIDRAEDVGPYIRETGVTYPILVGQSDAMEAAGRFGPDFVGLPFTVFISADRQILLMHSGELLRTQLDEILTVIDDIASDGLSVADARTRLNR